MQVKSERMVRRDAGALRRAESDSRSAAGDAQLLQAFLQGRDEAAFAELVRRHGPLVLGISRRILRNSADADDAFQATFLVLAMKAQSIRKPDSLADWLFGVAVRISKKARGLALLQRQRREQLMAMLLTRSFAGDRRTAELSRAVDEEIERLPDKYRAVILRCYLQGKTKRETARELGWPEGTVATRLTAARQMLKRRLERAGVGSSVPAITAVLAAMKPPKVPAPLAAAANSAPIAVARHSAGALASARAMQLANGACKAMFIAKMKIAVGLLIALAMMASAATHLGRKPGIDPKADALLDKSLSELACLRTYSMHLDYRQDILHHAGADHRWSGDITSADIRADGEKFDLIDQTWNMETGKTALVPEYKMRTIWDGKREIHRQQYQGPGAQQIQPSASSHTFVFRANGGCGACLYGVAAGDTVPMAQVMLDSRRATLRPQPEKVLGHLCSVIDAKTERGTYTLWFDPDAGYQFRRAVVVRKAGDLSYDNKPLASDGTDATMTGIKLDIHDVQIDNIDGHFVPMQAVQEETDSRGGGTYESYRMTAKRSHLQFNPDFEKMGAFVMDGIPEGTPVANMDSEGPMQRRILVWRGGKVSVEGIHPPPPPSHQPAVGDAALPITGVDVNGKPLRLSDYRGKVVVVVFWATSCGPCMAMVPHERELVRWNKDKPFALLGVNSFDSRAQARATMNKEHMTWPSWFDGGGRSGPIQEQWDIRGWPAIFVIDPKGIIRYKDVRGEDLDRAVNSLLKEAQKQVSSAAN